VHADRLVPGRTDRRTHAGNLAVLRRLLPLGRCRPQADYVFEIVYGVSANPRSWWDNSNAARLGYQPQDSAEAWAQSLKGRVSAHAIDELFQGGPFCSPDFSGDVDRIV